MDIKEGIVICDNETKMNILKNREGFINYKFNTLKSLKDKLLGSVSDEGKYYLFKKYKYSLDFINTILEFISFVDVNTIYKSNKINEIKNIKIDLINNGYYVLDLNFKNILKRFHVTFINVMETRENLYLIELVKKLTDITIVNNELNNKQIDYYECINQEEEVINYLEIIVNNKLDLNKVCFVNYSSDYLSIFKRLGYAYKLNFNIENNMTILSNKHIKYFLDNLDLDFNGIINEIKDNDIKNIIIDVINKYSIPLSELKDSKEFLKDVFKKESYDNLKYGEGINVTNNLSFNNDDIVFFLNFNSDIPKLKSNSYLSDDELTELNISNITEYNKIYKNSFIKSLVNVNNLSISYPLNTKTGENTKSPLVDDLKLNKKNVNIKISSSYVLNKHMLGKHYDDYISYNKENELLDKYDLNILDYNKFDNSFKPFKEIPTYDYLSNMKLSYSTMKTYFCCPFRYYLDNVLKIKKYSTSINANIGTYAHYLLEKSYDDDFNFEAEKEKYLNEVDFSAKELVFAEFMDDIVKNTLKFNYKYESISELDLVLREENLETEICGIKFTGFVDKLLYKETDDSVYVTIIDYKTGKDEPKLNNLNDGLNLQLPIYAYLIKNAERFKDKHIYIIGLYLQKVEIKKVDSLDKLEDDYKLRGFTNSDKSLARMLDCKLEGNYIKSLKLTKNGDFQKYAKLIDDKQISDILELIPNLVLKLKKSYLNMMFPINPYRLKDDNGCLYCEYKRVCYKTEKDYKELKVESEDDDNGVD